MTDELRNLVPSEVSGWKGQEDGLFDPDTLFDHIDGGAEVYRALNVRAVFSRTFVHPSAPDILVDVFDMGSANDAFGAFHNDTREDPSAGVGTESEVSGGNVFFWKGRYFVSAVALGEGAGVERAVRTIAGAIADNIPEAGQPPELVGLLPDDGRVAGHLSYFHQWEHLNTRLFITHEDLLGLDAGTEGVAARYSGPATLVVVRYPTAARAESGAKRFAARLLGGRLSTPVQRDDDSWSAVRHHGSLVIAVWGARSRATTRRLVNAVKENP